MTGFEKWVQENNTTEEEVRVLLEAAGVTPDMMLGDSLTTDTPIPNGRSAALQGMLERGRRGETEVSVNMVMKATSRGTDDVINAMAKAITDAGRKPDGDSTTSDLLPAIITNLTGKTVDVTAPMPQPDQAPVDAPETAPADAGTPADAEAPANTEAQDAAGQDDAKPEAGAAGTGAENAGEPAQPEKPKRRAAKKAVAEEAPKAAPRRKTKYSVSKAIASELFKLTENALSVRDIRIFLLSLPDFKPQDVALMSDEDVKFVFGKRFVCVPMNGGTLILPNGGYADLVSALTSSESYFLPADGNAAADEGQSE